MSKGSEGSSNTVLSNEEAKAYKKVPSAANYGRKKSPTPFKLRKYN